MAAAKVFSWIFGRPFPPPRVRKQGLSEATAALFSSHGQVLINLCDLLSHCGKSPVWLYTWVNLEQRKNSNFLAFARVEIILCNQFLNFRDLVLKKVVACLIIEIIFKFDFPEFFCVSKNCMRFLLRVCVLPTLTDSWVALQKPFIVSSSHSKDLIFYITSYIIRISWHFVDKVGPYERFVVNVKQQ